MSKGKLLFSIVLLPLLAIAQVNYVSNNIFQTDYFIENRGQYNYQQEGKHKILYGTEMPFGNVFFHKNGFSIKQKKAKPKRIHEQPEYNFAKAELMENMIHLEWIGADPNCELIQEQKSNHYFSFGPEEYKSYGYKKLTYKNIYPNIDIVYTIEDNQRFHYSILLHKGARVSDIKMKYHNVDVNILEGETSLELQNTVFPVFEYGLKCNKLNQAKDSLPCIYTLSEGEIGFKAQGVGVVKEELEIDPWVASVTTLTGTGNANQKGYDVDYDSDGNLFVYGGGDDNFSFGTLRSKIAKYGITGNLIWTFNCAITSLFWNTSNPYISNFIIDKSNNKIYTGEGWNNSIGARIIRLTSTGIYDNFISSANTQYEECWEFQFNCATGDIIVMGGSTKSNLNAGIINKSSGSLSMSNITGIGPSGLQDILSSCIDNNAQLYAILASNWTPGVNNRIYKLNSAINGNVWNKYSGYRSFTEANNKHFVKNDSIIGTSNGFNALSANNQYLFYYDGKNLKAFRLTNGDTVGYPLSINAHVLMMQGGIESDNCNNIYIGGNNGNVLIYNFDGLNFNFVRQVAINGHSGKSVYDLKANKKNNTLYVSGDGFVAETSFSGCDSALIGFVIVSDCINKAVASVSNSLNGSTFDYVWTDTATNTIVQSKYNTNQVKDTFIGSFGKTYKFSINRNSICLPANITKFISFKPDTTVFRETVATCSFYKIGSKTYTQSGVYRDTIVEFGCPKIVLTTLTIYNKTIDTVRKVLCSGDSMNIKGQFIKLAGVYRDTLMTLKGCDSILVYIITTSSASSNTIQLYDSICPNQSRFFNNQRLTSDGIYTQTLKNIYGCDSNIILNLYVKPFISSTISATICSNNSYTFDGRSLTSPGTYYDTIKRSGQCDSFIVLNLTVNNVSTHTINQTICQGQSVLFGLKTYDKSGTYYDTIKRSGQCDSFVVLNLAVNNGSSNIINQTICQGQSLQVGLNTYDQTGTYTIPLKNSVNCDSIVTLNLTVTNAITHTLNLSICQGQSIQVGNKTFYSTGTYVEKLKNPNNCDSIVTLNLKVNPKYLFIENGATCKGVPYRFYHQNLSSSGVFYQNYNTIHGCDSIYELRLKVTEISGISQSEFCKGDSVKLKNRYVKNSGDYYDTFKLPSGCDSFHLTRVSVKSWPVSQVDTVLCLGDSFVYKSKTYRQPATIEDTFFSNYKTSCHKLHFIYLQFVDCDTINECQRVLIPSGFSPNDDGINDRFAPIILSEQAKILEFYVFNRWGEVVYNYLEDAKGWQGYHRGSEAPAGVYSFQLKYRCKGTQYTRAGNVTLIR